MLTFANEANKLMLIKTPKDYEQRNHVSCTCDGSPLHVDRAVDSNFALQLQLLNRFDIN